MRGKTDKTRGAEVRVSRAKSRVEARRKSRAAQAKAGRGRGMRMLRQASGGRGVGASLAAASASREEGKSRDRSGRKAEKRGRARARRTVPGPVAAARVEEAGKKGRDRRGRSRRKETGGLRRDTVAGLGDAGGRKEGAAHARAQAEKTAAGGKRGERRPVRVALLATAFLASLAALLWVYTATGVLNVRKVEVRGNEKLASSYLRSLSGITGDTHLLKMDVKAVESALLSEAYVARADVSRHFPDTVILEIAERKPHGIIFQNGGYHLVDAEGVVLESVDTRPRGMVEMVGLDLPLLFPGVEVGGTRFATVSALVSSLPPPLREMTDAAGFSAGEGLYLESRGTAVIYGEASQFSRKNMIALLALMGLVDRYGEVEYIDVSFPDHPVIKPAQSRGTEGPRGCEAA